MVRAGALAALVLLASASAAPGPDPKAPDPLAAEARRRSDALVEAGFNLTYGWNLSAPVRFEFLLPKASEEHRLSLWLETRGGEASVRLLGPDGAPLLAWSGRRGETDLTRALSAGRYVLEIDPPKSPGGARALFGVKGFVVHRCEMNADLTSEQPAAPARGFHWPYFLYVPKAARGGHLLVVPNNTGYATDDVDLVRAAATCEVRRQAALADRLGTPLLVPLFPRPPVGEDDNLYLHALTRAALAAEAPALKRVDLQLLAMADDARKLLAARGTAVDEKILLSGFSASGSFVNRFVFLHPGRVRAVACGSPGGWPIAPAAKAGGEELPYPVGTAGVAALTGKRVDERALKGVAWFFFLGGKDANDAVIYRDSFSKADETLVFRLFGPTPVSRWKKAEDLYAKAGLDARFVLFPGVAHEVTPEIDAAVAKFFEAALAAAPPAAP